MTQDEVNGITDKIRVPLDEIIKVFKENNTNFVNVVVSSNNDVWVININKMDNKIMDNILYQRKSINILGRLN